MKTPLQFILQNDGNFYQHEINTPKDQPQMHLCDAFAKRLIGRIPVEGEEFLFELSTQPFNGAKQIYAHRGCVGSKGLFYDTQKWVMGMPFIPSRMIARLGPQFDTSKEKRFYVKLTPIDSSIVEVELKRGYSFLDKTGHPIVCSKAVKFFSPSLMEENVIKMKISDKPFDGCKSVKLVRSGDNRFQFVGPQGYSVLDYPLNFHDKMIELINSLPDHQNMKNLYFNFMKKK